jgi:hypothetical protein
MRCHKRVDCAALCIVATALYSGTRVAHVSMVRLAGRPGNATVFRSGQCLLDLEVPIIRAVVRVQA